MGLLHFIGRDNSRNGAGGALDQGAGEALDAGFAPAARRYFITVHGPLPHPPDSGSLRASGAMAVRGSMSDCDGKAGA